MEEVSRRSSVGVVSQRLTRALRKRAMLKQRKEERKKATFDWGNFHDAASTGKE